MKVAFIINSEKDKDLYYTKILIDFIIKNNVTPIVDYKLKNIINNENVIYAHSPTLYKIVDFIIVLGGDGTILKAAKKIAKYEKNILGINMGTLGYLADVEKQDAFSAIEKVLKNDYTIEKRIMLSAYLQNKELLCLNEVNINNGNSSRMIKIGIDINGKFVDSVRADGVIISTPTGSTAYNLSAGGPILKPDTKLIAITYVCPHTLFSRPYVISAEDEISVYIIDNDAYLSLDGEKSIRIKSGNIINIKKSSYYTNIIKTTGLSFYDILRRKMVEIRK